MQKLPNDVEIGKGSSLSIDYAPTVAPLVVPDRIELLSNSFLFNNKKAKARPPLPEPTLPDDRDGQEVTVIFHEYVFNSAGFASFDAGLLVKYLKSEEVPDTFPIKLNTDYLDTIMPGLVTKYGAGKKVDVNIKANTFPSAVMEVDTIS